MKRRPRLLDLFCGAGGVAMGYHRAGFTVVGVDNRPMPRYPFRFHQADALEYLAEHGHEFDAIHASPPCQKYSRVNCLQHLQGRDYPDLIGPTRQALIDAGKIWVIENVETAPLFCAIQLCGSSFGLLVRRHRLFESSELLLGNGCNHGWQEQGGKRFPAAFRSRKDSSDGKVRCLSTVVQVYGNTSGKKLWPEAMGIDWMTSREITQAIPPAFTEFIGRQLIQRLQV
jgi:DNA (cytosine-5)-methyltransferase 1